MEQDKSVLSGLFVDTVMTLQMEIEHLMLDPTFKSVDNRLAMLCHLAEQLGYRDDQFLLTGMLTFSEFRDLIFLLQKLFGEVVPVLFSSVSARLEQLGGGGSQTLEEVVALFNSINENIGNIESLSHLLQENVQAMQSADKVEDVEQDVQMGIMNMFGDGGSSDMNEDSDYDLDEDSDEETDEDFEEDEEVDEEDDD